MIFVALLRSVYLINYYDIFSFIVSFIIYL